jgi:DNA invertase Pin-like site-specific DNA recombinase
MLLTMLCAMAELERDLVIERTMAGLARAKAKGKKLGRPAKTNANQRDAIRARLKQGETVSSVARQFGISRALVIAIRGRSD